jgi:DNA polymerase
MHEGITDYLEIMRLAGMSELRKTTGSKGDNRQQTADGNRQHRTSSDERSAVAISHTPTGGHSPPPLASRPPVREYQLDTKAGQLLQLANEVAQCTRCKDLEANRIQTVFGVGNPDSPLVFLGEAPGKEEDEQGEPFVGRAGQLLNDIITKGMKIRREDVYICNILRCRPPGNRNPMPDEAAHCRPFLDRTLEIIGPKFICCLGAVAAKNLLASEKTIGALRGKIWEYNGIKVVCTYHPAYLLRNPAAKEDTWEDIQLLMREMEMK